MLYSREDPVINSLLRIMQTKELVREAVLRSN